VVLSLSAGVFVMWPLRNKGVLSQWPHDKDTGRGGEYHRLHVQFRPPDDGPVRPETRRGNPDTVYRQKRIVYQVGNKDKINFFIVRIETRRDFFD
jgi:hypothetical protein